MRYKTGENPLASGVQRCIAENGAQETGEAPAMMPTPIHAQGTRLKYQQRSFGQHEPRRRHATTLRTTSPLQTARAGHPLRPEPSCSVWSASRSHAA